MNSAELINKVFEGRYFAGPPRYALDRLSIENVMFRVFHRAKVAQKWHFDFVANVYGRGLKRKINGELTGRWPGSGIDYSRTGGRRGSSWGRSAVITISGKTLERWIKNASRHPTAYKVWLDEIRPQLETWLEKAKTMPKLQAAQFIEPPAQLDLQPTDLVIRYPKELSSQQVLDLLEEGGYRFIEADPDWSYESPERPLRHSGARMEWRRTLLRSKAMPGDRLAELRLSEAWPKFFILLNEEEEQRLKLALRRASIKLVNRLLSPEEGE